MAKKFKEVPVKGLRFCVEPESLKVNSTDKLCPVKHKVVGQKRAMEAIEFGIAMSDPEYNIYMAGRTDTGATYIARSFLEEIAKKQDPPPDWCYVHNFKETDKPIALKIPPGQGGDLKKALDDLTRGLKETIRTALNADDYRYKEQVLRKEYENKRRKIVDALRENVEAQGFLLQMDSQGVAIMPGKNGKVIPPEELANHSAKEKKALRVKGDKLSVEMNRSMGDMARLESKLIEQRKKLDKKVALSVIGKKMQPIFYKFKRRPQVIEYLETVKEDILGHLDDFRKPREDTAPQGAPPGTVWPPALNNYRVNVFIDNSETKGAPVVYSSLPTYPALFGRIEKEAIYGALITDFTMIRPGALHEANGGYLVLKAMDILKWYFAWEALKRAIRHKEVKIEDISEMYGFMTTKTLKPGPIPLNVKVVVTGDPYLYELLYIYDDRFKQMFKIKAHLDDQTSRNKTSIHQCIQCMARFCEEEGLKHVDRNGIARLIEYSLEITGNRDKLTLRLGAVGDIIKEANFWAGKERKKYIAATHVEKAIEKKKYRANLVEEKVQELVKKDIFWVETDGSRVGQVNGLSILQTGDYTFGKPGRITANVSMGKDGIITIDRESKLSGKTHTKGVMILSNYLRERFAQEKPLALTASLCFEQTYGMIDGDSASSAELFALFSAIADVPVFQGIAATGSVSQKGEIQPVGGVTRKIEGFFDICMHKGLTGKQGVIMPAKSVKELMLKKELVGAVEKGGFHIYPIKTIEEGIEILTGMKAGKKRKNGTYSRGSLFRLVDDRLRGFAEKARDFAKDKEITRE